MRKGETPTVRAIVVCEDNPTFMKLLQGIRKIFQKLGIADIGTGGAYLTKDLSQSRAS